MFALTTKDFAWAAGVSPSTIRAAVSRKGNFRGVKAVVLQSGRLLWPADEVDKALHTYTLIQPWNAREIQDIHEALAFVQVVATALENQEKFILSQAAAENVRWFRDVSVELENCQVVINQLKKAFSIGVAA